MSGESEPTGSGDSEGAAGEPGTDATATPEQLLGVARAARRQARRARHAYWFPLTLFGLLICASIPFYLQQEAPNRNCVHAPPGRGCGVQGAFPAVPPAPLHYLGGIGGPAVRSGSAYYWLAAMLAGLAATAVWYRLRGGRVGVRTPSRGFVITGLVLLILALVIPVLAAYGSGPLAVLMPGDLIVRGTFPLVLFGLVLCALAWAERSVALTVIAAGYLASSLVASLYDVQNVLYRLGWTLSVPVNRLPNVVLPALVLLLSGAGAWAVQRRYQVPPASATGAEAS